MTLTKIILALGLLVASASSSPLLQLEVDQIDSLDGVDDDYSLPSDSESDLWNAADEPELSAWPRETEVNSTTLASTTLASTTLESTTLESTTLESTTLESTTLESTTLESTTLESTTLESTTLESTTLESTTLESTTLESTTLAATTSETTTLEAEDAVAEESGSSAATAYFSFFSIILAFICFIELN